MFRRKRILVLFTFLAVLCALPFQSVFASAALPKVYVGGAPIGITLKTDGLVVIGRSDVVTEKGLVNTLEESNIQKGDLLLCVEDHPVSSSEELSAIINREEYRGKTLAIRLKRGDREIETKFTPALDLITGEYKAGLWVKEDTMGIGTLTYVRADNFEYGALGHAVVDPDTKQNVRLRVGEVTHCSVTGYQRGQRGKAGELKGVFVNMKSPIGSVTRNTDLGIYGKMNKPVIQALYPEPMEIMPRDQIRPGKASILCTISGSTPTEYAIEITKVNHQNKASDKSLVIRVTDKRLLESTGGIVQGMSGSPILQNGKLVGAVTHVFINDPARGYGVFVEWMLEQ